MAQEIERNTAQKAEQKETRREEKIKRFLETFFKATQIEAMYFDCQLNAVSCHYRGYLDEDFPRISMGRIENFLKEAFEKKEEPPKRLYTYYLDHNLVCNIAFLSDAGICCGAVVTQPVSLNMLKKTDIEAKLGNFKRGFAEQDKYIAALQRAPVIAYEKTIAMGEVLSALSDCVFEKTAFQPIFCGGEAITNPYPFLQPGKPFPHKHQPIFTDRHSGYSTYLKIKDCITKGNVAALVDTLHAIDFSNIHLDQQSSKNVIRSLKNSFIEGCAMFSFVAIEAGVPYNKARDLTEEIIRDIEATENISDIYKIMQSALMAFTRSVAVTRITGYSKPVRLVMEYIETHYAEKITLKLLAEHAGLSEFYLSNLIKKETGINITDIINKVRIEESKKILLKSRISIAELAGMVGYTYSNHFSKVFKQYTGMTPSGFIKSVSVSSEPGSGSKDMLRMILEQLSYALSLFPGIFDIVRIVDPVSNMAWTMQLSREMAQGTCYDFWCREQSCEKCISQMALEEDKPFMKVDEGPNGVFLVVAAPVAIGSKKYIAELLKNAADHYFDCTAANKGEMPSS